MPFGQQPSSKEFAGHSNPYPSNTISELAARRPWPRTSESFESIESERDSRTDKASTTAKSYNASYPSSRQQKAAGSKPLSQDTASTTPRRSPPKHMHQAYPSSSLARPSKPERLELSQDPLERWQSETVLNSPWNGISSINVSSPKTTQSSSRRRRPSLEYSSSLSYVEERTRYASPSKPEGGSRRR